MPDESQLTLRIALDQPTFDELVQTAGDRGMQPHELVERWIRERLAHERERRIGRERPQRPPD